MRKSHIPHTFTDERMDGQTEVNNSVASLLKSTNLKNSSLEIDIFNGRFALFLSRKSFLEKNSFYDIFSKAFQTYNITII